MISVHQCFYMFLFKCYLTVPVFWWLAECFNCMAAIVVSALKWRSLLAKPAALVQTVVQPMGTRWHLSTFVIFSSSLIITLLLQKRTVKEWQGGRERRKQFIQNKTTELSQDHKDTQQELPFSQSKIHTRSCVVLQQQRRQQPEQARKLHFRETKKRKKKRWGGGRRGGGGGKEVKTQLCLPLFLSSLKVCQQTEHEREKEKEEDRKKEANETGT